jgi:hypothetical protein
VDGPLKSFYAACAVEAANLPALSPSTTAAAAITAAATLTASAAIPATPAASRFRPRFVDVQCPAVEFRAVQMSNSRLRSLRIRHFHKCETAGLPGVTIRNDIYALDAAVCGEGRMQVILRSLITEISDKYVGHSFGPFD